MIRVSAVLNGINTERLDEELTAEYGNLYRGFAVEDRGVGQVVVTVNVDDTVRRGDVQAFLQLYDPSRKTADQQAREDREAKVAAAYVVRGTELDIGQYSAEPAAILALARKVAWLEQELLKLREERTIPLG